MKKDVTTFTRYFFLLIMVFVMWLFMLHHFINEPNIANSLAQEESSL